MLTVTVFCFAVVKGCLHVSTDVKSISTNRLESLKDIIVQEIPPPKTSLSKSLFSPDLLR